MRLAALLLLVGPLPALADSLPRARHGIPPDPKTFPQAEAKQTLASVLKAAEQKKVDYLLAHLAEPDWVDARVKAYGGKFQELVAETRDHLTSGILKRLAKFLQEGDWRIEDDTAVVRLKNDRERVVRFRKKEGRWFLLNDYRP